MNERDFCYWLQGMLELSRTDNLDPHQVAMIRDHLSLVFTKVTKTNEQEKVVDFPHYFDWRTMETPKYYPPKFAPYSQVNLENPKVIDSDTIPMSC